MHRSSLGAFPVSILPPIGDLVHPRPISEPEFLALQGKLGGMYKTEVPFRLEAEVVPQIPERIQVRLICL